jgi:hypothetical protein
VTLIDFSPVRNGETKILEFAAQFSVDQLLAANNASIDFILDLIRDLDDAGVTFDPLDPDANDPDAIEGEEKIGWSIAHLIAHVTASTEEWAAYASILARGIPYPAEPRLRYETPWRDITTKAHCVQRLEESRRIRNGYLSAFPDQPFYEVKRGLSPRYIERFGEINAPAAFLFGLFHEEGHYEQMKEVKRQALAAKQGTSA